MRLAGRDRVTLTELDDVLGARALTRLARLRQVDVASERSVRRAEAPDRVGGAGEERDHEDDEEEVLADGEEACAEEGVRTEHEDLEEEDAEPDPVEGQRPGLTSALVRAICKVMLVSDFAHRRERARRERGDTQKTKRNRYL